MKKWMLCVLALAMIGICIDTAEAGGRRSRSSSGWSNSYSSYSGGGYAPTYGTSTTTTSQPASGQVVSGGYGAAYQGETVSPMQAPLTQSTYVVPSSGQIVNGTTETAPTYYYPPSSYPVYTPSYGSGYSGWTGGRCSGGR